MIKKLLIIIVLTILGGIAYITVYQKKQIDQATLTWLSDQLSPEQLAILSQNAQLKLASVSQQTQEVATQASSVLGTAITATSSGESLHQRAFDYGRYLYCQQVVKEYDQTQTTK